MAVHGSSAMSVSRVLSDLRKQLELLKGEVGRVIAKLDVGLERLLGWRKLATRNWPKLQW